ncbi:hypothetical protein PFISCL1PPCAC_24793, partial [Pristionchus fissidentatus]
SFSSTSSPRIPSMLGEDDSNDFFLQQFDEQKKRLESSTLGPFKRRRPSTISNSIERSVERDEPSGESRRITTEKTVDEGPEKEEFHPRRAFVPSLPSHRIENSLPITSSPIGRNLTLDELRISRAQSAMDREISEALKTKSVDDLLREQIRRINEEDDGRR